MPRLGAMQLEEDKITVFSYSIISNTLLYKQYDYAFYISHLPKFEYLGPKAGRYSGNATKLSGKTLMLVTRALICICCVVAMWRKHYTVYSIHSVVFTLVAKVKCCCASSSAYNTKLA